MRSEFSLRSHASLDSMVKAIQEMVPLAQGTMTGLAIRYTMNVAFTAAEGDRPKVSDPAKVALRRVSLRPDGSTLAGPQRGRDRDRRASAGPRGRGGR